MIIKNKTAVFLTFYSRAILCFWGLLFLSLFIFNIRQYQLFVHSLSTITVRFLVPATLAGLFLYLITRSLQTRLIVTNSLVAVTVALYTGEFYLAYRLAASQQQAIDRTHGEFDTRDKLTVIKDRRASHVDTYPVIRAENLLLDDAQGVLQPVLSADGKPLLPMASIPGTEVVSCNESGQWQIYVADRHGFNNDDRQWDTPPVIGMLGDSFAHGSCVSREQNMAAYLDKQFGGVLNLGVGGFGPMLELAALSEYLKPLKPPIVLWFFFEGNDLNEDLPHEYSAPVLQNYLHDADFSQDLMHRSGEVAVILRSYLDKKMTEAMNRVDGPYENLIRYLSLDRLREAIGVGPVLIGYNFGDLDTEINQFREVIKAADQRVNSWGGRLYLVYLPESDRYLSEFGPSLIRQNIYQGVKNIALDEHIPFIDIAAAFARDSSPATLYAYPGAHFSPRGYRTAAATIADTLTTSQVPLTRTVH